MRVYQPGDDIRRVDWNVTARTGVPHIKRFVEEREQTIWLVVDASASVSNSKRRCAAEAGALLAFAAAAQGDRIGLIHFTNMPEQIIFPNKGERHARRIVRDLFTFQAENPHTSLDAALAVLRRRRRAVVFLISDFRDPLCGAALRVAAHKHDVTAVIVRDPTDDALPDVGLVQLADAETGPEVLVNSHDPRVRAAYAESARQRRVEVSQMLKRSGADSLDISTQGGHLEALLSFFHKRAIRR